MGPHLSLGRARAFVIAALASVLTFGSVTHASASPACWRVELGGGRFAVLIDGNMLPEAGQSKIDIRQWDGTMWVYDAQGSSHDCGGSTLSNTHYMFVVGTDGPNGLIMRDAQMFGHIPMDVDLGGAYDFLCLMGGEGNETFTGGYYQENGFEGHLFDRGRGVNMSAQNFEMSHFVGNGGNDNLVSRQGIFIPRLAAGSASRLSGGGTTSHVIVPMTIEGGKGNDTMVSGTGSDVHLGGPGKDKANGGAGKDLLKGGAGKDKLKGGGGKDKLNGGGGKDKCNGGPGKDKERGC